MKKFEQYLEMAQAQSDYQEILNARENNTDVYKNIDSKFGGIIAFNPTVYQNINIKKLIDLYINSKPVTKDSFQRMLKQDFKQNLPNDKKNWVGFGWSIT